MRRWWRRWYSTARCVWALATLTKINVKMHWWIETGKYAAWPDIERRILAAIRASDELHKREIGEYGSPERRAFLATLDEVERTMVECQAHMRRYYGR